jgi:hypothetical protein
MKRTSVMLLLFITLTAHADIIIERIGRTVHETGLGREVTLKLREMIVRDLDGTNGAAIATTVINGHKLYSISRSPTTQVFRTTVRGSRDREYTVVTQGVTETSETQILKVDGFLARGLNTTLEIGEARQIRYPRVFRASTHRVEQKDGEYRVIQSTYTRLFSQAETRAANAQGEDVETALARMVQRLEASGYRLVP